MTDRTYTELLASIQTDAAGMQTTHIPSNWMQGRTTYGGLTSALCLNAALPLSGGRPIRTAQIAFVGPVSGHVSATPTLLREGKNSVFASVRMMGEGGIAAEAIFTFGAARETSIDFQNLPAPDVPRANDIVPMMQGKRVGPSFMDNFDVRFAAGAAPISGADTADITLWMRHREDTAPMDATTLLAIGDAPPPAVLAMYKQPGRISSMTWMAEFLTDEITTEDGWFLARHVGESCQGGYNSQAQTMWNSHGQPVMIGRQTIAVFT